MAYAPSYDTDNSVVCVYVDPESNIKKNIKSLAHEMIHVWQVERGDLCNQLWKGIDLSHLPYQFQPWEIEAWGSMDEVADGFFRGEFCTLSDLMNIMAKTDEVFDKIVEEATNQKNKESLKKIGKVAAAVGLGALIGM